jgi:hypothetical protein
VQGGSLLGEYIIYKYIPNDYIQIVGFHVELLHISVCFHKTSAHHIMVIGDKLFSHRISLDTYDMQKFKVTVTGLHQKCIIV